MSTPLLATKLYLPPPRPYCIPRPRLIERLNEGLQRSLTLICAPAGFGKTTLLSQWLAECTRPVAWLSLDDGENDTAHFLAYLIAAIQTVAPAIGRGLLPALLSPQPPATTAILASLTMRSLLLPSHSSLFLTTTTRLILGRLTRPSPFCLHTCQPRCTWYLPPARIHCCPWPAYAPAAS